MKKNQIKKMLLSGVLALGVLGGNVAPVFATSVGSGTTTTTPTSGTPGSGTSSGSTLKITTEVTTVNVTVPTTIPFVFKADGTNDVPTNLYVYNGSIADVYLQSIKLDSKNFNSDWKLVGTGYELNKMNTNTKYVRFTFGSKDAGVTKVVAPNSTNNIDEYDSGEATFSPNQIVIESKNNKLLDFDVERGSFTSSISEAEAFDMTLVFNFV